MAKNTWHTRWACVTGVIVVTTTVRLNVEENQLVNVFGEFGICLGGLKSA